MLREIVHFFRHGPSSLRLKLTLPQAELYDTLMQRSEDAGLRARRAALVSDLQGDVLEIGCGTGMMFEHYPAGARVTAIEPAEAFLARAKGPAEAARAAITLAHGRAEQVPLPDGSVDAVVVALVLCSVPKRALTRVLGELARVLRPGGELRLLEHVISERPVAAAMMHAANPLWRLANGQGCNMNRDPLPPLRAAGFEVVDASPLYQIFADGLPAFPHRTIRARLP